MSNLGLDIMAKREGINIVKTKVGDRYVLENMLENGHVLGGEQSDILFFLNIVLQETAFLRSTAS